MRVCRTFGTLGLASVLTLAAAGCVGRKVYDEALADLQRARTDASHKGMRLAALEAEVARLTADIAARDARLADASTAQADLVRKLDELAVMNAELSERLRKAGQSVEQLASERGTLASALAETRSRLEELRRQQAVAEERAAQFRELVARFQKLADAGKLRVVMRRGLMLLELPNDILFDSGKTAVKEVARATITEVGSVLRGMPQRQFQVAGHTDDVQIQIAKFPSNWELSTARAVEVTKLLVGGGVQPGNLSAAGYGEFAPVSPNDTPEGRAKNRRIEIALVPNLEEMVKIPGTAETPAAQPEKPPAHPAPRQRVR